MTAAKRARVLGDDWRDCAAAARGGGGAGRALDDAAAAGGPGAAGTPGRELRFRTGGLDRFRGRASLAPTGDLARGREQPGLGACRWPQGIAAVAVPDDGGRAGRSDGALGRRGPLRGSRWLGPAREFGSSRVPSPPGASTRTVGSRMPVQPARPRPAPARRDPAPSGPTSAACDPECPGLPAGAAGCGSAVWPAVSKPARSLCRGLDGVRPGSEASRGRRDRPDGRSPGARWRPLARAGPRERHAPACSGVRTRQRGAGRRAARAVPQVTAMAPRRA